MKAIVLQNNHGEGPLARGLSIVPASAMVMPGKPLFLPDYGSGWTATPHRAWRICRLGKSVERRFAARYVDAHATAYILRPAEADVDGSVVAAADATFALTPFVAETNPDDTPVEALSELSRYMTLQMGDILVEGPASGPAEAVVKGSDIGGIRIR